MLLAAELPTQILVQPRDQLLTSGEASVGQEGLQAVLPLGNGHLWSWRQRTQVMAVINLTPDSFSAGGQVCESSSLHNQRSTSTHSA